MRTPTLTTLAAAALLTLALAGCAPAGDSAGDTGSDPETGAEDTTSEETETETGGMLVLSGTGEYASGESIPIGGYQLSGEPTELPAGCTWSLYDADGAVLAENQGSYVYITDVTGKFITSGCPDWEQFE